MNDLHHYQNPKTALIRLLKSQGCLQTQNSFAKQTSNPDNMMRYKQQLQLRVAEERARLSEIPCVITLSEEVEELKQVISGLGRQNRQRIEYLKQLQMHSGTNAELQLSEQQEQLEHERLQTEYADLLRTLEMTNETNRRLVQRLSNY